MSHLYTDIVVIGGGMVGGTLALGLAQHGFSVTVVERTKIPKFDRVRQPGVRVSAINIRSVDLLRSLNVWETILAMRAHPYHRMEAWSWEGMHITFDATELKIPLLGYMIENDILQLALWQALKKRPEVTLRKLTSFKMLYRNNNQLLIELDSGEMLTTRLIIGADGSNSQVRQMAGIRVHAYQYRQFCMLITVECENKPGESTWQYFTPNGNYAFLPLFEHWATLVWYDTPARICQLQKMPIAQLQHEIDNYFPTKLGKIKPIAIGAFSLTRHHALKYVLEGLALVGDAAHTVHPLAGQGLNLGYRDVSILIEVLTNAFDHGEEWAREKILKRYQTKRLIDNFVMQSGIDMFYTGFSNNCRLVKLLCNTGIIITERISILKHYLLRYILGL